MFEIGASLREARERRGLSPADVQTSLRIRERYLTALEQERWELLPGEAYAKGFLRTYAEFLGLNGVLYVDEFNARVALHDDEPILPETLAPRRNRVGFLARLVVGLGVVAVAAAAASAWKPGSDAAPHVDVASAATPKPFVPRGMPVARVDAPAPPATARIRATKARTWLSVRIGGPGGREVFRGFLNRGHELTYRLDRKVWLRLGRPQAVAITIGARLVRGLPGAPANLVLTKSGPLAG